MIRISGKENEGKWVALSKDNKILGLSDNLVSLRKEIGLETEAIYTKVLSPGKIYALVECII